MRRERQFSIDALKHKQTQSIALVESPPEPVESVQNIRNPYVHSLIHLFCENFI